MSGVEGACAFGAEISEDRSRCVVAAAWRGPDGRPVAEIVWKGHPALAPAEIARLCAAHVPAAVVIDGRSPSATLLKPLTDHLVAVKQPSAQEIAIAWGEFMDLVRDGQLAHLDQPELTEAVRAARPRWLAGGHAWERKVATDQAPLVAATLAVWALLHVPRIPEPDIF